MVLNSKSIFNIICFTIYTLRNIQHLQYESLYIFLTTNKVGIVSGENFEMEEYMPKIINELLSLR